MGDSSTGNVILDWFAYLSNALATNIGGVALSVILVCAYVDVMNSIQATTMLGYLIKKPLGKIRNPYILAAMVLAIGCVFRTIVSQGPAVTVLFIGTFLPILLSCGCSLVTAAVVMGFFNIWNYGPADPTALAAAQLMGIEVELAEWFVSAQVPIVAISLVIAVVGYVLISILLDKKETYSKPDNIVDVQTAPQVPLIYAVLPMLPLIFMLVFSPFFISSISMDVNTCMVLCVLVTALVLLVSKRKASAVTDTLKQFFAALGENMKGLGMIIVFAICFAGCLNKVGGMKVLAEFIMTLDMPPVMLVEIICIFSAAIAMIVGSLFGALSIALPLSVTMMAGTGLDAQVLCFLVLFAVGVGCQSSPVNPGVIVVTGKCNVEVGSILKRTIPVGWAAMIITAAVACLIF